MVICLCNISRKALIVITHCLLKTLSLYHTKIINYNVIEYE